MIRSVHRILLLTLVILAVWPVMAGRRIPPLMEQNEWIEAVKRQGVEPDSIVNPIEITEEMREVARRVAGEGTERQQLTQLQAYLFNEKEFSFTYEVDSTLTAREAFEGRAGNCVAFTNLFIAMARSLGIKVLPALVYRLGKPEVEGDLIIIRNHIVAAHRHSNITTVYDFYRYRENALIGFHFIDDLWNTAVYLNNMGARALRDGDNETALFMFESAVRLAPDFIAAYGNLGVARRRTGDIDGAFEAYVRALRTNQLNPSLRANLYNLLNLKLEDKLDSLGITMETLPEGPEYLTLEGDIFLAKRNIRDARKTYHRAREADPESADPLLGLARAELIRGRLNWAGKYLDQARELDPDSSEQAVLRKTLETMIADKARD